MRPIQLSLLLILLTAGTLGLAAPPAPAAEPDPFALTEPKIIKIAKKKNIRVVYDVKDDVWDAGIGKALYYARGLLEAYKGLGVPQKEIKISVVLHGPTVYWALKDAPYREFKNDEFAFNPNEHVIQELLKHGVSVDVERASPRWCSAPSDGPAKGISIVPHWDYMLDNYYKLMGWDKKTGKPLPETLKSLGLDDVARELWSDVAASR